eukprot:UN28172
MCKSRSIIQCSASTVKQRFGRFTHKQYFVSINIYTFLLPIALFRKLRITANHDKVTLSHA